jgi:hypothetical protein
MYCLIGMIFQFIVSQAEVKMVTYGYIILTPIISKSRSRFEAYIKIRIKFCSERIEGKL